MWRIIVIVLVGLLAFGVTGPKLMKMSQIKGWISGAEIEKVIVTQKWYQTSDIHPSGDTFWISWTEKNIKEVGSHRINVIKEKWNTIEIGDSLEIIYIEGDSSPYLEDGIFVEFGNFIFDIILFIVELGLIIGVTINFIRNRKALYLQRK